eukprot:TRINITY_DN738_c0_g1_i1.p1 TRINITY_DN738_c0_g1~~TRINITY_DN738_c0_g1_i1.p1  ORF type:complete len:397 (+),score=62.98 TRINITY_DN738_c0_g1_i1:215-1405(+)
MLAIGLKPALGAVARKQQILVSSLRSTSFSIFPASTAFLCFKLANSSVFARIRLPYSLQTRRPRLYYSVYASSSSSSSLPTTEEGEWNQVQQQKASLHVPGIEQRVSYISVKAYFLSTSVDLKGLQYEHSQAIVPSSSRSANYVILKHTKTSPRYEAHLISKAINDKRDLWNNSCYMVVFNYGSVVLFNIDEHDEETYLQMVRKYALGLLSETRKDDYAVVEKPSLEYWMQGGPDHIVLKRFDVDGIRIIGSVLGQSVALDHFVRQVDGMVAEFTDLNRQMEKSGNFTMKQVKLFRLVGKANSNLADVILKLGLFERSDIAWKDANYAQIWEYLRDEYELTQRFGNLDFKLKFVEHNVRFFLEILQNKKSAFLEWLIIILISAEIFIALYNIAHVS